MAADKLSPTLACGPGRGALRVAIRWRPPPCSREVLSATAIFVASTVAFLLSPLAHGWPFVDTSVYQAGGRAVLDGARLYDLRFPGDLAFTYPPLSALLFTPLTLLPTAAVNMATAAISIALLPAVLLLALELPTPAGRLGSRQARPLALVAAAAGLWLEPMWATLRYGQIDLLIVALVLFDLSRPDRSPVKGVALGLAAGLKLTPAIFIVYLLLSRRWRAAAVAGGTFLATVLLGIAAIPRDATQFWGGAFADPSRVGRIENAANQSLRGGLARLAHSLQVQPWWLGAAVLVGLVGLGLAVRAARRGDDATGFCLCALTGLLVSPISWSHHWVIALPALLVAGLGAYRRHSRIGLFAVTAAAGVGCSHMIWLVPIGLHRHAELHLQTGQQLLADAYILCGLVALGWAAYSVAGPRARRAHLDPSGVVTERGAVGERTQRAGAV